MQSAVGPPLTANRTMGSLGGLVASRIAREFRIGGPSFSVSCDETSGTQALQIAMDWLDRKELDNVIVGSVDLAGDLRAVLAASKVSGPAAPGEGATALVLKRLDDALRDGDRVYSVIREVITVTDRAIGPAEADNAIFSSHGATGSVVSAIGRAGSATGLAAVVRSALCLYHQIIPDPRPDADHAGGPRFWLRNRTEGPRLAEICASGLGGTSHTVILEGIDDELQPREVIELERAQPLGARRLAIFSLEADDRQGLAERARELTALADEDPDAPIERLARRWWARYKLDRSRVLGMAVIAGTFPSLRRGLDHAVQTLSEGRDLQSAAMCDVDVQVIPPRERPGSPPRVAFVYPGLGNVFAGMGRELSVLWPDICRAQDARLESMRDQFLPDVWWNPALPTVFEDHRGPILGQVAVGSLTTDILALLGVAPSAAIGYSMGESAALVSLHAWSDRDALARDLIRSPLFASELAGPCHAARRVWQLDAAAPVDWVAGIVPHSHTELEAAIEGRSRVYVLIHNASDESVIGGQRQAVRQLLDALGCTFLELPLVSTVHCEIGQAVLSEYRALHEQPTEAPEGLAFYSGVTGRAYHPDRDLAADAITTQATRPIDFPAVIDQAYADGYRVFLEMGPGASCTRLIGRILKDRPHLVQAVCAPGRDSLSVVLETMGRLIACRIPVNLEPLYGRQTLAVGLRPEDEPETSSPGRLITIAPGQQPPGMLRRPVCPQAEIPSIHSQGAYKPVPALMSVPVPEPAIATSMVISQLVATESATSSAHQAFLRVSTNYSTLIGKGLEHQLHMLESLARVTPSECEVLFDGQADHDQAGQQVLPSPKTVPCVLDRAQCLEFATGSIAVVLGQEYALIDGHPTRVRLPDEPLMLVDRIVAIEGEPRSLASGRVVTEHDILPGDWYLDAGKIPPSIAIESGQADLFLSAYLGIDFVTKGLAVYRLLDATVTFHRGLPVPEEVIQYDIRITRFFRQGDTHLFRFEFDGTVAGEPLLTMRDGCAGFFSAGELAAGKGVVPRPLDSRPRAGVKPSDWIDLVPHTRLSLDEREVEALRRGDLGGAFGSPFDTLTLADALPLPGGQLTLVHRVETLDTAGGRFGLGLIRAEADIHPDDWFMVCHFVDDQVMPGTLMYECCLHTLRIFLMRQGWVGARGKVAFEPLPGVANRLRCRGQVIASTRKVTYEVIIKELGYGPEPFAIGDALMYADGKPIVEITDMALRLSGTNRQELEQLWARSMKPSSASRHAPLESAPDITGAARTNPKVCYNKTQILAFAEGNPSEGFGDRYRQFDDGRFIARLPRPPYQFVDRIVAIEGEPWMMTAGTSAVAEYDIPDNAWYFEADRQRRVPYAVTLEAALQACGWVAAYMGSALTSSEPLKFRNLGGTACQHAFVGPGSGTLRTTVKATKVTRSAGMIIQHYEFSIRCGDALVFDGSTYFGFFHPEALAEQVGIRDASIYVPSAEERSAERSFPLPDRSPFPDKRWRMVERIDALVEDGGPHHLGFISGTAQVDPGAWFFQAHFLGDPVWPGSLGLESLLQLLKVVAVERWGCGEDPTFDSPALEVPHSWVYRGQIVGSNREVSTQAVVTARDDDRRWLKGNGHLLVDGKVIYQMNDFTLRLDASGTPARGA